MKRFNILLATSTVAFLATGCVKPAQDNQAIYDPAQPTYGTTATQQSGTYQETTTYDPSAGGIVYEGAESDNPVITTDTATQQAIGSVTTYPADTTYGGSTSSATTYPADTTYGSSTSSATTYPNTYGSSTSSATTYPDPYATTTGTTTTYPDPYTTQSVTHYPAATSSSAGNSGGIQLQIAALKDYYTAKDYKNRLSLAPGLSAYVKRGVMNKVIITGISSVAEANRLKENRFPGAFIVHGRRSGSYTPAVQPNYSTTYSVNHPYGTSSSTYSSGHSGTGVQIGAFSTRSKAQSVANSHTGRYPAKVKKIGRLYKVILTGFSSESAARSYAKRVGGFVVSSY